MSSKVVLLTALNATGDGNYDYIYMGAFYVSWCSRKTVPRVTRGFSHVKRSLELLVVEVT